MSALRSRGALLRQHHPKTRRPLDVHPGHPVWVCSSRPTRSAASPTIRAGAQEPRVTGVTDWTVTLAWDAPKGKPPPHMWWRSNGKSMTVAGSQTTATFSNGFDYSRVYSFSVFAVSSSGGWSGASNAVTATLLSDTTPAATPVVSSTGTVRLMSTSRGPIPTRTWSPRFDIYVNDQLWQGQVAGTAADRS